MASGNFDVAMACYDAKEFLADLSAAVDHVRDGATPNLYEGLDRYNRFDLVAVGQSKEFVDRLNTESRLVSKGLACIKSGLCDANLGSELSDASFGLLASCRRDYLGM